jgi:hypothetical protein
MRKLLLGTTLTLSLLAILELTSSLLPGRAAHQHINQGTHLAAPRPSSAASVNPSTSSTTSQKDQTDLSLTVYNSDLALVRDVREITLPGGNFRLKFMDVAASMNPVTVHFRSLTDPGRLNVLEQNYEYDLLDPQKLLAKYVGRELKVMWGPTEVTATLLADNNGPVWKIGNEIVTGFNPGVMHFPELPANLYDRPTLLWTLENSGPERQKVEASYLAARLAWSADYVLTANRDETAADLDGWVTLTNNSGTGFQNAQLQLVAGEVNRALPPRRAFQELEALAEKAPAATAPQFQQEAFNEYHLYTLSRRTSVLNNESKQVSLLNATSVPLMKTYEVDGQQYYYRSAMRPGAPMKDAVQVYYKLKNEEKANLGMPLPAGTVRVYQSDSRGNVLFAGEDRIDHTPKDEQLRLHIGNAFDVVAERKQTDFKKVWNDSYEMEYEITLRNHKTTPITVEVNEPIGGDWEMLNSTFKWTKTAAFAAQFSVPVEKDGTSVLRYRVRVRW